MADSQSTLSNNIFKMNQLGRQITTTATTRSFFNPPIFSIPTIAKTNSNLIYLPATNINNINTNSNLSFANTLTYTSDHISATFTTTTTSLSTTTTIATATTIATTTSNNNNSIPLYSPHNTFAIPNTNINQSIFNHYSNQHLQQYFTENKPNSRDQEIYNNNYLNYRTNILQDMTSHRKLAATPPEKKQSESLPSQTKQYYSSKQTSQAQSKLIDTQSKNKALYGNRGYSEHQSKQTHYPHHHKHASDLQNKHQHHHHQSKQATASNSRHNSDPRLITPQHSSHYKQARTDKELAASQFSQLSYKSNSNNNNNNNSNNNTYNTTATTPTLTPPPLPPPTNTTTTTVTTTTTSTTTTTTNNNNSNNNNTNNNNNAYYNAPKDTNVIDDNNNIENTFNSSNKSTLNLYSATQNLVPNLPTPFRTRNNNDATKSRSAITVASSPTIMTSSLPTTITSPTEIPCIYTATNNSTNTTPNPTHTISNIIDTDSSRNPPSTNQKINKQVNVSHLQPQQPQRMIPLNIKQEAKPIQDSTEVQLAFSSPNFSWIEENQITASENQSKMLDALSYSPLSFLNQIEYSDLYDISPIVVSSSTATNNTGNDGQLAVSSSNTKHLCSSESFKPISSTSVTISKSANQYSTVYSNTTHDVNSPSPVEDILQASIAETTNIPIVSTNSLRENLNSNFKVETFGLQKLSGMEQQLQNDLFQVQDQLKNTQDAITRLQKELDMHIHIENELEMKVELFAEKLQSIANRKKEILLETTRDLKAKRNLNSTRSHPYSSRISRKVRSPPQENASNVCESPEPVHSVGFLCNSPLEVTPDNDTLENTQKRPGPENVDIPSKKQCSSTTTTAGIIDNSQINSANENITSHPEIFQYQKQPRTSSGAVTYFSGAFTQHQSDYSILALKYSQDLFVASASWNCYRYDVITGKLLTTYVGHKQPVTCIEVSSSKNSQRRLYTGSSDKRIHCFDITTAHCLYIFSFDAEIMCLNIHKQVLLIGLSSGVMPCVSLNDNKLICRSLHHKPKAISIIATSKKYLFTGSFDCTIAINSLVNSLGSDNASVETSIIIVRQIKSHTSTILCLQLKGDILYSGSVDKTVMAHDVNTTNLIQKYSGHTMPVSNIQIEGDSLITGCLDKMIRVFNTSTGVLKQIYRHGFSDIFSLLIKHDHMYIGCKDGKLISIHIDLMRYYQCTWSECEIKFGRKEDLQDHLIDDHVSILKEGNLTICGWGFCRMDLTNSSTEELKAHIFSHVKELLPSKFYKSKSELVISS